MSRYDEEKKAPATGIVGTVLGGSALGLGLLGAFSAYNNGGSPILNLFGNRSGPGPAPVTAGYDTVSPMAVYVKQQECAGQQAVSELHVVEKWLLPLIGRVGELEKESAVTKATTPLLVALQGSQFQGQLDNAMSCVIKGKPMIVPKQIGNHFHGAYNELVTRHHPRHSHHDFGPFGPFSHERDCERRRDW